MGDFGACEALIEKQGVLTDSVGVSLQVTKELQIAVSRDRWRGLVKGLKVYSIEEGMLLKLRK